MNLQKFNKSILIFIVLTILYILSGHGVTISNDSVTNVDQISDLDLWSRSSHFSFHFFGIIFYLVFSSIIGLSAVTSIEIMLALFGAAGSVSLYLISIKKYNNINQALYDYIITTEKLNDCPKIFVNLNKDLICRSKEIKNGLRLLETV